MFFRLTMNCPVVSHINGSVIEGKFSNDTKLHEDLLLIVPIAPLSKIDTFLHIMFISQVKLLIKTIKVLNVFKPLFIQKREYRSTYL